MVIFCLAAVIFVGIISGFTYYTVVSIMLIVEMHLVIKSDSSSQPLYIAPAPTTANPDTAPATVLTVEVPTESTIESSGVTAGSVTLSQAAVQSRVLPQGELSNHKLRCILSSNHKLRCSLSSNHKLRCSRMFCLKVSYPVGSFISLCNQSSTEFQS